MELVCRILNGVLNVSCVPLSYSYPGFCKSVSLCYTPDKVIEPEKLTSDFLAGSVNVNPVVIRNTLGKLKKAGIVRVEAGIGGASLARDPSDITLLDIFNAVETDTDLFHFHENPNPQCPVGRSVHPVLGEQLASVQSAMESHLASISLNDLLRGIGE